MPATEYPTSEELEARRHAEELGTVIERADALELELAELREQVATLYVGLKSLAAVVHDKPVRVQGGVAVRPELLLGNVVDVVERLRPYFDTPASSS